VKPSFSWERFNDMPLVGIMRNISKQHAEILGMHYFKAGLGTLEVTMNSPESTKIIGSLVDMLGDRLNIGAGTVCTTQDLDMALEAGAQFIVTPILNETVVKACVANGVPVFPGAYTPTEIYAAWAMGASMVKVFPATQLGPGYIKEVLAPLNQIRLIPTGGVSIDNFTEFLAAGARAVAVGSHMFPAHLIKSGDWERMDEVLREFVEKYLRYKQLQSTS
jgi:2-dehydro-3-deoxyphosphogluconate aldolase / (4S)-4-hydroxy-2-oxoglutarate aldolase